MSERVNGYNIPNRKSLNTTIKIHEKNIWSQNFKADSIEVCKWVGQQIGAKYYGYRNENWGGKNNHTLKKTCFLMKEGDAYNGDINDNQHQVGCVNGNHIQTGCINKNINTSNTNTCDWDTNLGNKFVYLKEKKIPNATNLESDFTIDYDNHALCGFQAYNNTDADYYIYDSKNKKCSLYKSNFENKDQRKVCSDKDTTAFIAGCINGINIRDGC